MTRAAANALTAALVIAALLLAVALLSAALSEQTNWTVRVALAGFCALAILRPAAALLATTALLGFGVILSHLAGAPPLRVTEAMVLASLLGCTLHAMPSGPYRQALLDRAFVPVLLLALAALATLIVWLSVQQVQTNYMPEFARAALRYLVFDYLLQLGEFRLFVTAAMLVEGLALYMAVAAMGRHDATFFDRSLRMLALGGAGLGVMSAVRLGEILLRNPGALEALRATAAGLRISPQIADYIAAGSYFSLCWLVSLGLAIASKRWRWAWLAAGTPLVGAIYLTGSRSVIAAAIIGLVVMAGLSLRHRFAAMGWVPALAVLALGAMVFSYPWMTGRDVIGRTAALSVETRYELAKATVRVIQTAPWFGIGFNRFHMLADEQASPRLHELWQGPKNPHNDFLRIGADLGLIGLALLLWILIVASRRIWQRLRASPDVRLAGLVGGLAAFFITSLVSDPLMVREVSYAFWIALGLGVGHTAATSRTGGPVAPGTARLHRWAPVLIGVMLAVSVPPRATEQRRNANLRHVAYGLFDWGTDPDGTPNRWTGPRATFFVDGRAQVVEILLSGTLPGGVAQDVDISVDGRPADHARVGTDWQRVRLLLPGNARAATRRIDLQITPTWVPADVLGNDDTRELGVKVGVLQVTLPPDSR